METINITKKKFESLERYEIPNHIFNTEGQLYVLPIKNRWETQIKLLKRLYITNGLIFGNKLQTINSLIDHRKEIDVEEIVFPEKLAIVDSQVVGYTMPLINSINLQTALDAPNISLETKIKYLKQIGILLEKMKKTRTYTRLYDFYLNDIHENNFIIDSSTDSVRAIDIDSCKINGNFIFGARYLSPNALIKGINKYKKEERQSCGGYYVPSENTELYCYIIIILNYLSGRKITTFTLEDYYDYLDYLYSLGMNRHLLDIFEKIVSNSENENPYELLDSLIPFIGRCNYNVYSYVKKRKDN